MITDGLADATDALAEALEQARMRRSLPAVSQRRRIRERAGLTQTALAGALGVDRATVSRWESGERTPRESLSAYLDALNRLERATP